jgi:hypothetical protein
MRNSINDRTLWNRFLVVIWVVSAHVFEYIVDKTIGTEPIARESVGQYLVLHRWQHTLLWSVPQFQYSYIKVQILIPLCVEAEQVQINVSNHVVYNNE